MVGAGFGGCVLALADKSVDKELVAGILDEYGRASGQRGAAHCVAVSEGASVWDMRQN